jgi:hypothetical protein
MDRHCYQADGVLVLNRVKLHTCFSGPVQSGLVKMMVVGMGKIRSAKTFHSAPTAQMKEMLLEMGRLLLDSGKIWAGLAILEDGFDRRPSCTRCGRKRFSRPNRACSSGTGITFPNCPSTS